MDLMLRDKSFRKVQPIIKPSFVCNSGLYGTSKNDFRLILSESQPLPLGFMLTYGTSELGGVILDRITDTNSKTVTYIGKSFRGQLENSIIAPFAVLTLSGTDYDIVKQIVNLSQLNYEVLPTGRTEERTAVFPLGTNALQAIDLALSAFDEKMLIDVSNNGVEINILPTSKRDFDASQIQLVVDENKMIPTALHARSKELSVSVYVQSDGTVGTERYYTGFDAVEISQEISASTEQELTVLAADKLLALRKSQNASEINVKIEDADIGDKIKVSVKEFGIKATQTVNEKILKIEGKNEQIIFNTGG